MDNYNLTINTSMRSHGKWGDFLVALIPLSWCGNILINSNFILRMLEWQNESSLFTIRIQGKQWYWAYKYNSDTNVNLNNIFINTGNNNWVLNKNSSNNNTGILSFIYDYEFKKTHSNLLNKISLNKQMFKKLNTNTSKSLYIINAGSFKNETNNFLNKYKNDNSIKDFNIKNYKFNNKIKYYSWYSKYNIEGANKVNWLSKLFYNNTNKLSKFSNVLNSNFKSISYFENDKLDDTFISSDNYRLKNSKYPLKISKGTLNKHTVSTLINSKRITSNILFNFKISKLNISDKYSHVEQFWGFRQKRYKKLRSYAFSQNNKFNNLNYEFIINFNNNMFNKYQLYNAIKNNKYKNELIPVTLARRLLRTKRTLVLPVHVNITLITNSYDVVHSWFVPGLGLKIDCVPGRSTHHSLYIDNVGFYYGQCAEICGRYHHHMPIRVCAIPFEHFLIWWQTKGMHRLYRSSKISKQNSLLQKFNN